MLKSSHFLGQILGCVYTICSYGQISFSCRIPSGLPCLPSRVQSYSLSVLICCIRLLCDWLFCLYHITYNYYYNYYYWDVSKVILAFSNFDFKSFSYAILLLASFLRQFKWKVFHWSLSVSKSPQLSRTLLSILDNPSSALVWIVSILPRISYSPILFSFFLGLFQVLRLWLILKSTSYFTTF